MPSWLPPANPSERERWDKLLIERLAERDPRAETSFIKTYGPKIRAAIESKLCRANGVDLRADADDLLQAVMVKLSEDAWRRLRLWRGDASLATWLSRIAVNATVDWLRTRRADPLHRPEDVELLDGIPDLVPRVHQEVEIAEIKRNVREAVNRIENQRYRDLLLLQIDEDLEPTEIAERLRLNHGNTRVLLNRARNALREVMQQEFPYLVYGRNDGA